MEEPVLTIEIVHEANKYVQLHVNKRTDQLRNLSLHQHFVGTVVWHHGGWYGKYKVK